MASKITETLIKCKKKLIPKWINEMHALTIDICSRFMYTHNPSQGTTLSRKTATIKLRRSCFGNTF